MWHRRTAAANVVACWLLVGSGMVVAFPTRAIALPDLVVSLIDGVPSANPGQHTSFRFRVKNQGVSSAVGGFDNVVYLSTDSTITSGDTAVCDDYDPGTIAVGSQHEYVWDCVIPAGLATGFYHWGVITDNGGFLVESNENNNAAAGNTVAVGPVSRPDLAADQVQGELAVIQNQTVNLSWRTKNIGDASTDYAQGGLFNTCIYLSTDIEVTTGDTEIKCINEGAIAAHGAALNGPAVTIPSGLPDGVYFWGVITDRGGFVVESNETNNTAYASEGVLVGENLISADGFESNNTCRWSVSVPAGCP